MLTIGKRIRTLRKSLNLSQDGFAEKLGITNGFVSNLEKDVREPSEPLLRLMCYEFSCSADWLTTGEGEMFLAPEEVIKIQMARYGERAFIKAFSKVLDEKDMVVPISVPDNRRDKEHDQDLSDMIDFLYDLWAVADPKQKIWAREQFDRGFANYIKDEVEKKLAALHPNATSS